MRYIAIGMIGLVAVGLGACKSDSQKNEADSRIADSQAPAKDNGAVAPDASVDSSVPPQCAGDGQTAKVVTFKTDDDVKLEADLYLSGQANGPAAVLLHMVPPANDRTNYPPAFIEALVSKGVTVLNVDRRGAGKSEGNAADAHTGPNGKLDAKAAHDFLKSHACPIDVERIVCVGASNGTTTVVDLTVHAATESSVALPAALVFLTGGTYTENQNKIADHREIFDKLPIQFVYSSDEKTWSVGFEASKAAGWEFREYAGGDHGTKMFAAKPASINVVANFVGKAVAP